MNKFMVLAAAWLFMIPQISSHVTSAISGKVLDREGKPIANAVVVYSDSATGRVYQLKTGKKGEFSAIGVFAGYYTIEITAPDGKRVYSGTRSVGTTKDNDPKPLETNVLIVDLSTVRPTGEMATSTGGGKMSKADLKAIRKENANAARINQLIPELHSAVDARDWARATNILQQLIAADPNRWEFYQNLGSIQSDAMQDAAAVQTFEKGIELARQTMTSAPSPEARANVSGMLISQAESYDRMGKLDEAIARYNQAAELASQPALAHLYACNALRHGGRPEAAILECDQAITACDKAIASDPTMADAYFVKGSVLFGKGQLEQGKYQVPEGTRQALTRYLELSPDGIHAVEARAMLEQIGAKIETTEKPRSKSGNDR